MGVFATNFIEFLVLAIWLLIIGRVIVSFVDPLGRNQASAFVIAVTEPLLAPIRRVLPPTGMLDLSPLVLMLILGVILRLVGI